MASKGNIKGIIKHAKYLDKLNYNYLPFAQEVSELAIEFQDHKILQLIQECQRNSLYRHPI
ncbi:MAG: hypothetical protein QNJ68_19170 [Microcoleaceae cyanobacterium MO_207.B10]|nr:hypothetical protein [Microcoleaceae cyanobacterium MO_207.B10]